MSKNEFTIAKPKTKKVDVYASQKKEVTAVILLDRLKRLWPLQWVRSTRFGSDTFGFSAAARGIVVGVWFTSPNPTGYVGAHNKQILGQALGTLLYLMRKEVETLTEEALPAVVDEGTLLQRSLWESLKEFLPDGWWKFDEVTRQASRVLSSAPDARLLMYFRAKPDESIELVLGLAASTSTVAERGVNLHWAVTVHGEGVVSDMAEAVNSVIAQMYGLNEEVVAVATP